MNLRFATGILYRVHTHAWCIYYVEDSFCFETLCFTCAGSTFFSNVSIDYARINIFVVCFDTCARCTFTSTGKIMFSMLRVKTLSRISPPPPGARWRRYNFYSFKTYLLRWDSLLFSFCLTTVGRRSNRAVRYVFTILVRNRNSWTLTTTVPAVTNAARAVYGKLLSSSPNSAHSAFEIYAAQTKRSLTYRYYWNI